MKNPAQYYSVQYNARAGIPDHPEIFARWATESAQARRTILGLFDLQYGETAGEKLDFFPASERGAPLLVFIHGGWWRSLDKSDFSFVAPAYVRAGINVALTNYTLAPDASIEQIVMQQLHALAWLYRHAAKYRFDAQRIVVAGHSAGAHLTAMTLAALFPVLAPDLPPNLVRAAVMMSGLYDLDPVRHADFVANDLRLTSARIGPLSPAFLPQSHSAPFITAVGALESDEFQRQNTLIGQMWKPRHVADIALPHANHLTICDAFGSAKSALFDATVGLVANLR